MGRGIRRGWYSREEIEKVTLDWVKTNCRITDREMELLKIIKDRKLVRRDHLEIISPSYRKIGTNRTEILNRSIRKLFRKICIDKIHEERELGKGGNNPCIVSLDRGGSLLLGIPHKKRIIRSNEHGYVKRRLPLNYRHINGVNSLEVETIKFCERNGGIICVWCHEKPQELHYAQEKLLVVPDVYTEIKFDISKSKSLHAFIEFDTGSEDRGNKTDFPIIRQKLIKYKKLKMSRLWEKNYPYFPILMFVTEDNERIPFFNRKCKEYGLQGWGIYIDNYTAFLERLAQI